MQETQVQSLGQEDSLKKGMATQSCILAWRVPWKEEPGSLQSMGSQRVRHDWATNTFKVSLFCIRITDSLFCTVETNNIVKQLYSNKKIKEWKWEGSCNGSKARKDVGWRRGLQGTWGKERRKSRAKDRRDKDEKEEARGSRRQSDIAVLTGWVSFQILSKWKNCLAAFSSFVMIVLCISAKLTSG